MNNREALAISIDNEAVPCPFSSAAPFRLSKEWLESALASYGGKCREHDAICANVCKEYRSRSCPAPAHLHLSLHSLRDRSSFSQQQPLAAASPSNLAAASRRSSFSQQPLTASPSSLWQQPLSERLLVTSFLPVRPSQAAMTDRKTASEA